MTDAPQQNTPTASPTLLDPELLAKNVDALQKMIDNEGGCNRLTVAMAERVSDVREGGHPANVARIMPKLMEINPATGKQYRDAIDISDGAGKLNSDGVFQAHEYTVAYLVGAKLAVELGVKISEVPIDQRFIEEAKSMCPLVVQQMCAVPSR